MFWWDLCFQIDVEDEEETVKESSKFLEDWHIALIAVCLAVPVFITGGVILYCWREGQKHHDALKK